MANFILDLPYSRTKRLPPAPTFRDLCSGREIKGTWTDITTCSYPAERRVFIALPVPDLSLKYLTGTY
jgi:hypothetical protein